MKLPHLALAALTLATLTLSATAAPLPLEQFKEVLLRKIEGKDLTAATNIAARSLREALEQRANRKLAPQYMNACVRALRPLETFTLTGTTVNRLIRSLMQGYFPEGTRCRLDDHVFQRAIHSAIKALPSTQRMFSTTGERILNTIRNHALSHDCPQEKVDAYLEKLDKRYFSLPIIET